NSQTAPSKAKSANCEAFTSRLISMASLKSAHLCMDPVVAVKLEDPARSNFPWYLSEYLIGIAQAQSVKDVLKKQGEFDKAMSNPIRDDECVHSVANGT